MSEDWYKGALFALREIKNSLDLRAVFGVAGGNSYISAARAFRDMSAESGFPLPIIGQSTNINTLLQRVDSRTLIAAVPADKIMPSKDVGPEQTNAGFDLKKGGLLCLTLDSLIYINARNGEFETYAKSDLRDNEDVREQFLGRFEFRDFSLFSGVFGKGRTYTPVLQLLVNSGSLTPPSASTSWANQQPTL